MEFRQDDKLREVRLRPYQKGCGPTFTLVMWATESEDWRGQPFIGYCLKQHEGGKTTVVFRGEDFSGSPLHADDSDVTVAALLDFLTLRPGDTDDEWFDRYTPEQLEWCQLHGEALSCASMCRFGEGRLNDDEH